MNSIVFGAQRWQRPVWLTLLIASSVVFTLALACATPLAAFGAIAAMTLVRRDAYIVAVGVWLANQAVGFACLQYPLDANCLAWGLVLGITSVLCTLAARQAVSWLGGSLLLRGFAAFLIAFVAYEGSLYLAALVLGGTDIFTLRIQGRIFLINGFAMIGLLLLNWVGSALRIAPARRMAHA